MPYNPYLTLYVTYGQYMSPKTERFEMRMDPETLSRIDEWRRKQADLPSRAEAMRRLVELGLKVKGKARS